MAPDASISNTHGWDDCNEEATQFVGMTREEARVAIVAWFKTNDLLEEIRDYEHSVGHSYRSHVPIEPYLSDQWYVKVTDDRLCNEALRAIVDEQYDGSPPARDSGARVGDGELRFYPPRYARTYQAWHENLRDWCISRQLWWGHQIPVWCKLFDAGENPTCPCDHHDAVAVSQETDGDGVTKVFACVAGENQSVEQELESAGFIRDEDVLDTWFSSALWPLSTMGWPDPNAFPETKGLLDRFNPTSVLTTAREIITLWVSRMVMFNRYFRDGILPFNDVYIHPIVQDGFGQKMSKSLGNGVDPRDIISTHGTDAMRYSLVQLAAGSQDVRLGVNLICPYSNKAFEPAYVQSKTGHKVMAPIQDSPDDPSKKMSTLYGILIGEVEDDANTPLAINTSPRFDVGRNFANKFWNAARFALMNITAPAETVECATLQPADHWMLHRVTIAVDRMNEAFETYQFNIAIDAMYDVLWRDFCDWYLEAIKPTIKDDQSGQRVLHTVLDVLCRLIHPVCPFVTEAMWHHIHTVKSGGIVGLELPASDLAATASWPVVSGLKLDDGAVASFERAKELITVVRAIRAENKIASKQTIDLLVPETLFELASLHQTIISSLAGVGSIAIIDSDSTGLAMPFEGENILLTNVEDSSQSEEGAARLKNEIEALENQISGFRSRLENDSYVSKAPVEVVQETKDMLAKAERDLTTAQEALSK
jgi:valyl-tRNA synthetase